MQNSTFMETRFEPRPLTEKSFFPLALVVWSSAYAAISESEMSFYGSVTRSPLNAAYVSWSLHAPASSIPTTILGFVALEGRARWNSVKGLSERVSAPALRPLLDGIPGFPARDLGGKGDGHQMVDLDVLEGGELLNLTGKAVGNLNDQHGHGCGRQMSSREIWCEVPVGHRKAASRKLVSSTARSMNGLDRGVFPFVANTPATKGMGIGS